ncbi:SDR family oxidoreductase [Amycolatopsis carbonis]|uniref:SDR family oxidoreductase n=1 Tax=Amycolatopsis carbonis TaxID=715471 RepID=A0A9Y2IPF1_9PSEU|nr:SDR family oxidoreductase [Amycolatopsis sp. 2-15]WIX83669.1 SDR family oxidoreductase [Amycolatopsis sp. 2-15]
MNAGLAGRTIVVTGGGQGLGRAYAQRVATDGGTVVIADINAEAGERVATEIADAGGKACFHYLDVADPASCSDFARFVSSEFGALHGLVNNAAIFSTIVMRPFWEIPIEEWDRLMAVNLRGPFLLTSALLPALRLGGDSSIVNVASDAVWLGRAGYLHYTASKAGVTGMTYSMSRELGTDGIRVNAISPGPTYTEVPRGTVSAAQKEAMHAAQALHRDAGPEDMVGVVAFLLSDDSRFMTGQVLSVSGGLLHR